jgi:hypothetical protein
MHHHRLAFVIAIVFCFIPHSDMEVSLLFVG